MNFNSSISPWWTLQVGCLFLCVCCVRTCALFVCVCLTYIQMSLPCLFVNRWSCQRVRCSLKWGRKWLFFFSNHPAKAGALYEMTAIIKLTLSERQALLSPWKHTYTLIHKHTHLQAFTVADRVVAKQTANKTAVVTGLDLLALKEETWHLYLITDPWCVSAGFYLHYRSLILSTNLIRSDQTGPVRVKLHFLSILQSSFYLSIRF